MRLEIPDFKRCCICVPLRYGLIIFGYLNLIFSSVFLAFQIIYIVEHRNNKENMTTHVIYLYKGAAMYTQIWIPILLYSLEVVFNISLLIGTHTKLVQFIRVYYYYGVTTSLATVVTFFIVRYDTKYLRFDLLECSLVFSGLVIQVYLLLLTRSELMKSRYQEGRMSYMNHMTELVTDS